MNRLLFLILPLFPATAGIAQSTESQVGRLTADQVRNIVGGAGDVRVDDGWNRTLREIKRVQPGATVQVYLGAWCSDSKQEIPEFLRILDAFDDKPPFGVEFYGVDESKKQPMLEIKAHDISNLPTFIVFRKGREIGRIVEQPARTLENDLLRLLDGRARGLLSSNENAIVRYLSGDHTGLEAQ